MCPALLRKPYPSDVSDEEWSLVVPYLKLMKEAAPQRDYPLRELFNALRTSSHLDAAGSDKRCASHEMLHCTKSLCAKQTVGVLSNPQRRFGALLLGRFLPKLGGAFGRRHFSRVPV
jgi:transposase